MAQITYSIPYRANGDKLSYSIESTNNRDTISVLSKYNDITFIKNLIGNNIIYPRFRIFVLNPDDTTCYEIPQEDVILGGSYSENYQSGQRRSVSFSLFNEDGKYTPSINGLWVNSRISLEIGLQIPDTDITIWFKKGIYVISNISVSRTESAKTVSVECGDKFLALEGMGGTMSETVEIQEGVLIEDVINDILRSSKGNGDPIDYKPIIYHSSFKGKTLPIKISGSAGSTWGSLILQLADVLSAEVFYNVEGNLTFVPIVEMMSDGDKPVIYDYIDTQGDFQSTSYPFNLSQFVNRVVVIGATVDGHMCTATAVNNDPASPLCVQRIGFHTKSPINDSNITLDVLAQERADYELRLELIAKSQCNCPVFFNPLLEVNNLVTFTDEFFGLKRERMLIQSISCSLDYSGIMTLNATNIHNLPFITA